MEELISIKGGKKNKLLIKFSNRVKPEEAAVCLDEKLAQEDRDFWKNSSLILHTGNLSLSKEQLRDVRRVFENKYDMFFAELRTSSERTRNTCEVMGWAVSNDSSESQTSLPRDKNISNGHDLETEYIRQTIRGGSRVESHGNVVIVGDVNPGSEVYALGDIIVFGGLRGSAFAGTGGNENAVIVSLKMEPVQIGIGTYLSRSPDSSVGSKKQRLKEEVYPEIARVEEGQIIIDLF